MKKIICLLMAGLCLLGAAALAEDAPLTGKTAQEIVDAMGIGWNMGNTFDATGYNAPDIYSHETSWGNPVVDQALIQRVKDGGFTCIRIPISWYRHVSEDGAFTIDPAFMARIREVVDYAYDLDMYIIINMHHEAWLNTTTMDRDYETIGVQLAAMWKQIADEFADYDQHLIFESMNEPRMAGTSVEWNGNKAGFAAVNYLNQVFVETIRTDAKGHNGERALMIPGYAASSSYAAMSAIQIPTLNGQQAENIVISVHCYSPYDFCLSDKQTAFNPSNKAHTNSIDTVFANIEKLFLEKGIPVVMGETGATNTQNNHEDRGRWAFYMGAKSTAYGVPILIWDNGNNQISGGECHVWVRRAINEKLRSQRTPYPYQAVLDQLMAGYTSCERGSGRRELEPMKSALNGVLLWGNQNGLKAAKEWDNTFIQLPSDAAWYDSARMFAVIYTGTGSPKLVMDSAEKELWWIPVDPDRIDNIGGKQVAWFNTSTILAACTAAGVETPAQLRYMSVMSTGGLITAYEVCYIK